MIGADVSFTAPEIALQDKEVLKVKVNNANNGGLLSVIDGLPGFISLERGGVLQVTALEIRDGRIAGIYITRNPDKLRRVAEAVAMPPAR